MTGPQRNILDELVQRGPLPVGNFHAMVVNSLVTQGWATRAGTWLLITSEGRATLAQRRPGDEPAQ
jgi:hypothetical protein